jgi:hypothetical protein
MANRADDLRRLAVAIVAESQPVTPEEFMSRLRQYGASQPEAYRTLLELLRDGQLTRTFFGELVLPGHQYSRRGRGYSPGIKLLVVVLLLAIVAFMLWVFSHLFFGVDAGPPWGSSGASAIYLGTGLLALPEAKCLRACDFLQAAALGAPVDLGRKQRHRGGRRQHRRIPAAPPDGHANGDEWPAGTAAEPPVEWLV